jgi:hypothetical protein
MSDKAEEFAKQLLEKTENGKLRWQFVAGDLSENYRTDLEDGFSFWIKRKTDGDNKVITFTLTQPEGTVLSKVVDNILAVGQVKALEGFGISAFPKVNQFRLFSNLFHAARKSAVVENGTLQKVQQLLERLA